VYADELLVTSYEYNSKTPRFYSKYFRAVDPGRYDVLLRTAVAASSSAPIYFDPKTYTNKLDIKETLIDGGLICNNPSLYAF
jgi:patatin-like phospholipase/acyl hydrolase